MEATGGYWFAYQELLDVSGIEVNLVNPEDNKNIPGRKSDAENCKWIQQLYAYGLLCRCFIPDDVIGQLSTSTGLRDDHISLASQHIDADYIGKKAFDLMNIKLHNIISQIHGISSLRIVRAIIAGNHNSRRLANFARRASLRKKRDSVIVSLK